MFQPKFIDDITSKIKSLISTSPAVDIEKNLRSVLQSALGKLDLVTREEFDAQTQVLSKTRTLLDALAKKVSALEGVKTTPAKTVTKPKAKPVAKAIAIAKPKTTAKPKAKPKAP